MNYEFSFFVSEKKEDPRARNLSNMLAESAQHVFQFEFVDESVTIFVE